jgi:hypothetical protein
MLLNEGEFESVRIMKRETARSPYAKPLAAAIEQVLAI